MVRAAALVAGAIVALLIPAASANAGLRSSDEVTVMSRNLYLGADLTPALTATNTTDLALAASAILETVNQTDFPARAEPLAREIKAAGADLVGLQEVALFRTDNDGSPDGPLTPATTPLYNFRGLLMEALREINAPYRVVQTQREADIEVPTAGGFDARLTMRDVILARDGVRVPKATGQNFATNLVIPNAGGVQGFNLTAYRGWTLVRANVDGNQFRFVNTHLESAHPGVRQAQAGELVSSVGPATARNPVILVGDMNSDPNAPEPADRLAYQTLIGAGLLQRSGPDPTFGFNETLTDPAPDFTQWIDHIFVNRDSIELVDTYVTGMDPALRSEAAPPLHGRLWPSDHGGVVSVLRFPSG